MRTNIRSTNLVLFTVLAFIIAGIVLTQQTAVATQDAPDTAQCRDSYEIVIPNTHGCGSYNGGLDFMVISWDGNLICNGGLNNNN